MNYTAIVAESLLNSLKKRVKKRIYKTLGIARAAIFNYIEVRYKRTGCHSHLSRVNSATAKAFKKTLL